MVEGLKVFMFEKEERKHYNTKALKHSNPMRILFTIPHYFRPTRHGFHGSERDADELSARMAGFDPTRVTECRFRRGRVPDVCALDLPVRNDESFYVEILR